MLKVILLSITIITSTRTNNMTKECDPIHEWNDIHTQIFGDTLSNFFDKELAEENSKNKHANIVDFYISMIRRIDLEKENPEEELELLVKVKDKPEFNHLEKCVYSQTKKKLYLFFTKKQKNLGKKNQNDFKEKLSKRQRLEVYKEVLETLDSLHKLHYIHGEIAPWNIGTDENYENVTLIDFKSSTIIGNPSKGRKVKATLSPEKWKKEDTKSTPKIDIYSLGMSILIIERGSEEALEDFKSSWNFNDFFNGMITMTEQQGYGKMKKHCLEFLKKNFNNQFYELVKNMTEKKASDRKEIKDLILILDQILDLDQEEKERQEQKERANIVNNVIKVLI